MNEMESIIRRITRLPDVEVRHGRKHRKVYHQGRYVASLSSSYSATQDRHAVRHLIRILEKAGISL